MLDGIMEKAQAWAKDPHLPQALRKEVADLIAAGMTDELVERFYRELEFGTGGMRGVMGAGRNRMNGPNICRATKALADYLKECFGEQKHLAVAISFDSRNRSEEYARVAAEILCAQGIKVYLTEKLRPVPMLSFLVRHKACQAGICITASHNPPKYNGFKVYFDDGGQIVPPHDKALEQRYMESASYNFPRTAFEEGRRSGGIELIGDELDEAYLERLQALNFYSAAEREAVKVVYTPLHGAGLTPMVKALRSFGFQDLLIVKEQAEADGNFPTVSSPNPEDPAALKLGKEYLLREGGDLLIATDPDCDRLAVVTNEQGRCVEFNGNEMGALLIDFVLGAKKAKGLLPKDALVIKTIVTTDLQSRIAASYGAAVEETLTGFKWIAQRIRLYEEGEIKPYRSYQCGGEESYGFLADTFVRDKDGIIAGVLMSAMCAFYKKRDLRLSQVLDRLYERHGYFLESLHTETLEGKAGSEKIAATMQNLRAHLPMHIGGFKVKSVKDYLCGQIFELGQNQDISGAKLSLPKSDVLQFILEDESKISIRPSGTEPKIKIYFSIVRPVGDAGLAGAKSSAQTALSDLSSAMRAKLG